MTEGGRYSRAARHEKRRNNKRKFLFFASLSIVFLIILFSLIAFGNREKDKNQVENDDHPETEIKTADNQQDDSSPEIELGDEVEAVGDIKDVDIKEVETTDENVLIAYVGNWDPIGTVQEGPHTTNYDEGSDDRIEIRRAVSIATGLDENNMIEHWIGNGGDQKVIATIQDKAKSDFYRAYLTWIDQQGWQVTKIERIKEFNSANGKEEDRDEG